MSSLDDRTLLVSIEGAATRLELWPGEFFDPQRFEQLGLSFEEFHQHPRPWSHPNRICVMHFSFNQAPELDLSDFDLVLIIDEEAIAGDPDVYLRNLGEKFRNPNVRIITSGYHQQFPYDQNRCYHYPFFMMSIASSVKDQLIDPIANNRRTFDVLLGMSKPHRDFVFTELAAQRMLNRCFVNLTTNRFHQDLQIIYRSPDLHQYEENDVLGVTQGIIDSYENIQGNGPRVSHVMPWKIFDGSLYSVVAETNWQHYLFFSEKTAKPLYAGRIFVFFGAAYSLDLLRRWGFKTFDNILDESYDTVMDNHQRFTAAFDQVLRLDQMPAHEVYQQAHDTIQHNRNHIRNREYFTQPLVQWINDIVLKSTTKS